jgi:ADP-L-glycero-D-manno-heptose 6-epimerase
MKRITVTGGFGFIGSNLVAHLNRRGIVPDVVVRTLDEQWRNVAGLSFKLITPDEIVDGSTVVALGANVDTTEPMNPTLWENNVNGLLDLWRKTRVRGGRFIYASSGSVYGSEEKDFTERIHGLRPLNAYAFSKLQIDNTLFGGLKEADTYGLRFTNIYGPRERHKGDMASLVHKGLTKQFPLYGSTNHVYDLKSPKKPCWRLFKSHRPDIKDGEQARDFCYVEDVCLVIEFFLEGDQAPGLYNLGTGTARTFNDLVKAVDPALPIEYTDMPEVLRNQYQYYAKADITKLRAAGYKAPFLTLEEGIEKTREWMKREGQIVG